DESDRLLPVLGGPPTGVSIGQERGFDRVCAVLGRHLDLSQLFHIEPVLPGDREILQILGNRALGYTLSHGPPPFSPVSRRSPPPLSTASRRSPLDASSSSRAQPNAKARISRAVDGLLLHVALHRLHEQAERFLLRAAGRLYLGVDHRARVEQAVVPLQQL